ncbi:putative non-specific serine/threonine protein kinase [Rosa chinensis]|uniref:Putative non-specific serine/threonine protein kinase n=1 Tax=Rosa chinensis TaxID=74649 RepID=A0A2P6Q8Q6_ROSCH|nr:putative non-specific serine/threonine protein kinase [Rosa chinensis]
MEAVEGRSIELLDLLVEDSSTLHEVLRSIHVGLFCVQQKPQDRPSMPAAVLILSCEGASPQPQKPGFFSERNLTEPEDSTDEATECSANELTITRVGAR